MWLSARDEKRWAFYIDTGLFPVSLSPRTSCFPLFATFVCALLLLFSPFSSFFLGHDLVGCVKRRQENKKDGF
jgi:hypothetical protein